MHAFPSFRTLLAKLLWPLALLSVPLVPAQATSYCGSPTVQTLYAGQTTNAGSVTVANDATNLYVTFTTMGGWMLQQTHLQVADSLASVPQTKTGNPKIGNFKFQTTHNPPVTEHTYVIAKSSLSLDANNSIVVAAHAAVVKLDASGNVISNETGWASGMPFTDRGSWATYFSYGWQTCTNPPPVVQTATETAFAHHGTSPGQCFLSLDVDRNGVNEFNRWGWTIGPLAPEAEYVFELYAGAAKCDLGKGTFVGTLTVSYLNGTAIVAYRTQGRNAETGVDYTLVEAQLYVGSEVLPRDVNGEFTVAPGQFPMVAGELKNVTSQSFTVSGLSGGIYVLAHATVAGFPIKP